MLLQDWTTVAGVDSTITQSRRGWLDLGNASNVTFWLDVRDVASDQGTVTLVYESAPADEDSLFNQVGSVVLGTTTKPVVSRIRLADDPTTALGRFVRWSVIGVGRWSASFRVFALPTSALEGALGMCGDTSGFRLSLVAGVPIPASDVTGMTVYLTPYRHSQILLYDGENWRRFTSDELSLAPTFLADKNYDVFAYYDSSARQVALELSTAWTNGTTRADAVSRKDGLLVKTADPTRRLVGTVHTDANNTIHDTLAARLLWNAENRVDRPMVVTESTASWLYSGSAWRAANGNSANAIQYVDGVGEDVVAAIAIGRANSTNSSPQLGLIGIGVDSTTSVSAQIRGADAVASSKAAIASRAYYQGYPGVGAHTLYWIERAGGTVNVVFAGSPGFNYQYGISGTVKA
jgi:hypothetical protein